MRNRAHAEALPIFSYHLPPSQLREPALVLTQEESLTCAVYQVVLTKVQESGNNLLSCTSAEDTLDLQYMPYFQPVCAWGGGLVAGVV